MSSRQVTFAALKPCEHDVVEDVRGYGGDKIGEQCTVCLEVIAGHGACAFCKKIGRLTFLLQVSNRRYCSRACRSDELAIETGKAVAK